MEEKGSSPKITATSLAKKAGALTQKATNSAQQFAQENQLKEKAQQAAQNLKTSAAASYEKNTGRSASMDSKIIAMSAVATAGAVAVSTIPAVMVGVRFIYCFNFTNLYLTIATIDGCRRFLIRDCISKRGSS